MDKKTTRQQADNCLQQGDLDGALQHYSELCRLAPSDVEAWHLCSAVHGMLGNFREAAECCETAISLNPGLGPVYQNYAHALIRLERYAEAVNALLKTVELMPSDQNNLETLFNVCQHLLDLGTHETVIHVTRTVLGKRPDLHRFRLLHASAQAGAGNTDAAAALLQELTSSPLAYEAYLLLGEILQQTGKSADATACYRNAINLQPRAQAPVARLSRVMIEGGDTERARRLLDEYIANNPESPEILVELGYVEYLTGKDESAEQHYQKAIALKPGYALAYNNLGTLHQKHKRDDAARDAFLTALKSDPGFIPARCNLAYLYCAEGDYPEALQNYQMVLELDQKEEIAISGKAVVLDRMGDKEQALDLVKPLVSGSNPNIHTSLTFARTCKTDDDRQQAIRLLEDALHNQILASPDRMQIYFTLGNLYDRIKEYDAAFINYEKGNDMNSFPFDRSAHMKLLKATKEILTRNNLRRFSSSNNDSSLPVFVIGMPRSGTTLVEQILASHPEIHGAGELSHIRDIALNLHIESGDSRLYPLNLPHITHDTLEQISHRYIGVLTSMMDGEKRVVDKMPANFMFLGLIQLLFPKAQIIHCIRNPLDTCLSCYFQQFSNGQYYSYNQSDLAFYYNTYTEYMDHWEQNIDLPILHLNYRDLVENQEKYSRQLVEFTGLEWHEGCLDFHNNKRKILTASYDQVRRPIYSRSINRWKHYEKYLTALKSELLIDS